MNWRKIESPEHLAEATEHSHQQPVLIFKHSTTCSISRTVLDRLQRNWNEAEMPVTAYYLDLLQYRTLSNGIAQHFQVTHESPQALLVCKGKVIYHESHFGIDYTKLKKAANDLLIM